MRIERRASEASAESWSDQELVNRMRHDEALAIREFYRRFAPVLLKIARRARVERAVRDDVVTDCLSDAALHLMQPAVTVPINVTGYLVATFRHRLANNRRALRRRTASDAKALFTSDGDPVVRALVSEASIRDSAGPDADPAPLSPVLDRLAHAINAGISSEDRQLLRWVSAGIAQRLIAEWLGITHNAARTRVLRLRDRVIEIAVRDNEPRRRGEREELYAFFRRSGLSERARRVIERSAGTTRGRKRPHGAQPRPTNEEDDDDGSR